MEFGVGDQLAKQDSQRCQSLINWIHEDNLFVL